MASGRVGVLLLRSGLLRSLVHRNVAFNKGGIAVLNVLFGKKCKCCGKPMKEEIVWQPFDWAEPIHLGFCSVACYAIAMTFADDFTDDQE